ATSPSPATASAPSRGGVDWLPQPGDHPMHRSHRRARITPRLESLESRSLLSLIATSATDAVPDELLVRFVDKSPAAHTALLNQVGARAIRSFQSGPVLLKLAPGVNRDAVLARLRQDPGVAYAQLNATVHIATTPNDPLFAQEWGLNNPGNDADID